ncbi:MAG: hypothetical protein JWO77_505 [Ilumatobacteraceae bacterium]|nr:hypothetical protein [Ilumatobacteraceae bacterium]
MLRSSPRSPARAVAVLAAGLLAALTACSGSESHLAADGVPTTIDIAENPDGGSFRLLTYNVGGLPVEINEGHPDVDLPQISPLLNDFELVLTQEDYDWWKPEGLASGFDFVNYHGRLRAQANHEYQSPQHPGPAEVGVDLAERPDLELGDGLGILADLPVDGDERVPWTGCFGGFSQDDGGKADCLAMKGFQVTELTLPNGAEVAIYNINAESGTNHRDQQLQAVDFEQLATHIAEHAAGRAVIVAGHTNLVLDDTAPASGGGQDGRIWEAFLESAGLTDACRAGACDDELVDRVAYRSGDDVELAATSHTLRGDRFVGADGDPLSTFEPLEVGFDWGPQQPG